MEKNINILERSRREERLESIEILHSWVSKAVEILFGFLYEGFPIRMKDGRKLGSHPVHTSSAADIPEAEDLLFVKHESLTPQTCFWFHVMKDNLSGTEL